MTGPVSFELSEWSELLKLMNSAQPDAALQSSNLAHHLIMEGVVEEIAEFLRYNSDKLSCVRNFEILKIAAF